MEEFSSKLKNLREILIRWSKQEFPNNNKLIQSLLSEFRGCCCGEWNEEIARKANDIVCKIDQIWAREEKYWFQRSRINWLNWGYENSRFFHNITAQHRRRNKVVCLKNEEGCG